MLSFPFLAKTGCNSLIQPIASPPPPSRDSLVSSNIEKFSILNFPSSLNLLSSIKNSAGFRLLITFLNVDNLDCNPAALTPSNLNDFEYSLALYLFPLLLYFLFIFFLKSIFRLLREVLVFSGLGKKPNLKLHLHLRHQFPFYYQIC